MNRQTKRSLEPSSNPKRTHKQQILCIAIEENYQALERTIQVYVTSVVKQFGNKFDVNSDRNSIETIATEILQETVATVLSKSEEFDLNKSSLPWIKRFAVNKVKSWQRDRTRSSDRVVSISKFSSPKNNLSEEEVLGILYKSSQSFNTEDSIMLENLLSLLTEGDRQVLELAFIDDLNGKDLAANLGVSEGAAYTKKSRAIARLREAYTQANPDSQEGK